MNFEKGLSNGMSNQTAEKIENLHLRIWAKKGLGAKTTPYNASQKAIKLPVQIHQSEVTSGATGNFISFWDALHFI